MGMCLSTIQIKNRNLFQQKQFTKILSNHMKEAGCVPASDEDAQFSYCFVLSKNESWITLTSPQYEPITQKALDDAQWIAKSMETDCILTNVVYSDQVSFDCFSTTGKEDRVQIGSYGGFDISQMPDGWAE